MGGRFGKYGDVKRKDRMRRNWPSNKKISKSKPGPLRVRKQLKKKNKA